MQRKRMEKTNRKEGGKALDRYSITELGIYRQWEMFLHLGTSCTASTTLLILPTRNFYCIFITTLSMAIVSTIY